MTYMDIVLILATATLISIVLIEISSAHYRRKMKKQCIYANIVQNMSRVQATYIKLAVIGKIQKYPNIDRIINNTISAFDRITSTADHLFSSISVSEELDHELCIKDYLREVTECPIEIEKLLVLNSRVIQQMCRIRNPALYHKINTEIFIMKKLVRLCSLFPSRKCTLIPKSERRMEKELACEFASVGIGL